MWSFHQFGTINQSSSWLFLFVCLFVWGLSDDHVMLWDCVAEFRYFVLFRRKGSLRSQWLRIMIQVRAWRVKCAQALECFFPKDRWELQFLLLTACANPLAKHVVGSCKGFGMICWKKLWFQSVEIYHYVVVCSWFSMHSFWLASLLLMLGCSSSSYAVGFEWKFAYAIGFLWFTDFLSLELESTND